MASCQGIDCGKPAKMKCPVCVKLGLPTIHSLFCSQTCFKANWKYHKMLHDAAKAQPTKSTLPEHFRGVCFTGSLRPAEVTPMMEVPESIARPDYADHPEGVPVSEQEGKVGVIIVHTPEEIEGMRTVCRLAREVLDIAASHIKVGVTTDEIDRVVHAACIERNSYPSPLNYRQFPKSLCTSVNEVICHGIPDMRPLENGDILNLDITLYHGGYHGDLNETYFVGEVSEEKKKLVRTAKECLDKAIAKVKPGMFYRDIGPIISKCAASHGCSVVRSYCGHGIGRLFHTSPNVPHYSNNKAVGVMKVGHIFTIEPMINMGRYQDKLWPDDWTAITADGKPSAQFEHTMVVTETGVDVLTKRLAGSRADA